MSVKNLFIVAWITFILILFSVVAYADSRYVLIVKTESGKVAAIPRVNAKECRASLVANFKTNRLFVTGVCMSKDGTKLDTFCTKEQCYGYVGDEPVEIKREDV